MLVIGITGTLGAGKGTVVDYLVRKKGFHHFSVRAYISDEIRKRGMDVDRDSMVIVANDLRRKHSPSYITDELFSEAVRTGGDAVIESIRTPGEVTSLREKGRFYLIAVDAPPETRYERIRKRQSETDHVSFETFIDDERREMNSNDPNAQNIARCLQMADFLLVNDNTILQLEKKVDQILVKINK